MEIVFENKIVSLEETKQTAVKLAQFINKGDIIVLNGNLGTGKTTFVKFFCELFNIDNVSSPSFSIVNEYFGAIKVYHFDFYRLKKLEELYDIGFEEYINDPETIVFIEWGDLMPEIIPTQHYEIKIDMNHDQERVLKFIKHG